MADQQVGTVIDRALEFPFASPGYPQRLEGRDAVRDYLRDYTDHADLRAVVSKVVHETTTPGVAVLVTGSTGTTGSRVTAFLRERGARVREASRRPTRQDQVRFDWADAATHADPLPLVEPFVSERVPEWTVLRPSWFMQNFTGDGRVAFVDDVPHNTDHVTGPDAFSYAEAATILAATTGRPISHRTFAEFVKTHF